MARVVESALTHGTGAKQREMPKSNAPVACERPSASPPRRSRTPARGTEPLAPEAPPPSTIALVCYCALNGGYKGGSEIYFLAPIMPHRLEDAPSSVTTHSLGLTSDYLAGLGLSALCIVG